MRKTILILLLAFPILSFAQENYLPFLEDGKVWSTVRKYPTGEAEYRMEVKGDTVLSGKKLYGLNHLNQELGIWGINAIINIKNYMIII